MSKLLASALGNSLFFCVAALAACGGQPGGSTGGSSDGSSSPPRPESPAPVQAPVPAPEPEAVPTEKPPPSSEPPVETVGDGGAAEAPPAADPGATGTIVGRVLYDGTPPPRQLIDMSAVTGCGEHAGETLTERLIVTDGKVANAFVYISRGLEGYQAPPVPSEPYLIEQSGCVYRPHVAFVRAGRKVHVANHDEVAHNVKLNSQRNGSQNKAQAAGSAPMEFVFQSAEVPITLACDYHPWMKSFVCVQAHPFGAVTGEDGSFRFEGLPPGKYTVSLWHEAFKTVREEVVLPAGGEKTLELHLK